MFNVPFLANSFVFDSFEIKRMTQIDQFLSNRAIDQGFYELSLIKQNDIQNASIKPKADSFGSIVNSKVGFLMSMAC